MARLLVGSTSWGGDDGVGGIRVPIGLGCVNTKAPRINTKKRDEGELNTYLYVGEQVAAGEGCLTVCLPFIICTNFPCSQSYFKLVIFLPLNAVLGGHPENGGGLHTHLASRAKITG